MRSFGTDAFVSAKDKRLMYNENDNENDEKIKKTLLVSQRRFPVMAVRQWRNPDVVYTEKKSTLLRLFVV